MKNSIKNQFIYKYIFLYGIFFCKYDSSLINNKKLFELIFLKDNEENKDTLFNMLNRTKKLYLNPLDIITGGIPRWFSWQSKKLLFNNTNLFIDKDTLSKYAYFQRNKLINFLELVETNASKNFDENIILDIGLDLLAFGEKSSLFHQNMEILNKWIDDKIIEATYDQTKTSLSFSTKLLGLKFQLLRYMPPRLAKDTLNTFFSKLTFLFTPFKTFEIIKNFDNTSLENFYTANFQLKSYMAGLEKEKDNNSDKKKEWENISKVMEQGIFLPIKAIYKDIDKIDLKTSKKTDEKSMWRKIKDSISDTFEPFFQPLRDADWLTQHINFDTEEFKKNGFKSFLTKEDKSSNNKIFLDEPDMKKQAEQIAEIKHLRNSILYENSIIERLQEKNMFIPAFWMEYFISKFQEIVENKLTSVFEGIIATLTLKNPNPYNNFAEAIVLSYEDNIKIENFLKILTKNIKNDGPLPSLLLAIYNPQIEALIKNYVYSLILKYPISRYKIRNPTTVTKNAIVKVSKKNMKANELQALTQKIFFNNINDFNNFLKVHFLNEEVKYMSFFSSMQIETLRYANKILEYMENPTYVGRRVFAVIEISGLELLCAPRDESKKRNTNSMATSTFVTYVSGTLYKDKFLFAFTKNLKSVDEAVKSRFTICSNIESLNGSLKLYVILVRRYLLTLMMKYKNILLLNEETFEKVIVELAYKFYSKNWTGGEIARFFKELEDKKRLKIYSNQYSKEQIIKLMDEVLV